MAVKQSSAPLPENGPEIAHKRFSCCTAYQLCWKTEKQGEKERKKRATLDRPTLILMLAQELQMKERNSELSIFMCRCSYQLNAPIVDQKGA
ncbi:hypothetical protein GHT06_008919 [Daphnia sinensis]|uniref:Uncharacterized protein n=1 Tax=Daphnia sinensis TaxID=1820382 RepID=A0AAD5LN80_9CRUS|nr:hypothetical protein GHT06_008919 [Daphnia sinensis]